MPGSARNGFATSRIALKPLPLLPFTVLKYYARFSKENENKTISSWAKKFVGKIESPPFVVRNNFVQSLFRSSLLAQLQSQQPSVPKCLCNCIEIILSVYTWAWGYDTWTIWSSINFLFHCILVVKFMKMCNRRPIKWYRFVAITSIV